MRVTWLAGVPRWKQEDATQAPQARGVSRRTRTSWLCLRASRRILYVTPTLPRCSHAVSRSPELAPFLGIRDINMTHNIYGHLLPSGAKRAVAALDAEYAEWSGTATFTRDREP